jgi:pyruvate/2-oxoacid:ferredoxin oxidoreductase beta subunit
MPTLPNVSTMSSETSTDTLSGRPAKAGRYDDGGPPMKPGDVTTPTTDQGLQAWQFFVLAALGCATAATFLARGQGFLPILMVAVLMAATALVGLAVLRSVRPLVSEHEDRTTMVGQRTRAALEREKLLSLRAIKELEFDRAMGKLSESDWQEMSGRLRTRAARLMRQLDAGAGYREQVEKDLAKRLGSAAAVEAEASVARFCAACGTPRDADAKFCKNCGTKL